MDGDEREYIQDLYRTLTQIGEEARDLASRHTPVVERKPRRPSSPPPRPWRAMKWAVALGAILSAALGSVVFNDGRSYANARGNIEQLKTYLASCTLCWNSASARSELANLESDQEGFQRARGNLEALRTYVANCRPCKFQSSAQEEINALEAKAAAEGEEQTYAAARGNAALLRAYLARCGVCAFKAAAENEIRQLETLAIVEQEQRTYSAARGSITLLEEYLAKCRACAFKAAAEEEVGSLKRKEAADQDRRAYNAARGSIALLRAYLNGCHVCAYRSAAEDDIKALEQREIAEQERRRYEAARGSIALLQAYLSACRICSYGTAAQNEIKTLTQKQLAEDEQRTYFAARGDLERLKAYVRACQICAFEAAARAEISDLEVPKVTFRIKSNHPSAVAVAFYSQNDRTRAWPGRDQHYRIVDWAEHSYPLTCERGEKICYGAWVEGGNLSPYWGAGLKGRQRCENCCFTCPARETGLITLEPSAAREPPPTMTWRIKKTYPLDLSLEFYSVSRPGHVWPGGGQVYILNNDAERNYTIGCMAGEKICYGAWVHGFREGIYWGAGSAGRNSCTSCCGTCNGGEYSANLTGR
jgi:hypothetical protein